MKKQRLLKLADFLDKLPRKKFNYSKFIEKTDEKGCGTICCAIGWTPVVFPRLMKWGEDMPQLRGQASTRSSYEISEVLFGLQEEDHEGLFYPHCQDQIGEKFLGFEATPKQLARLIRRFVKKKEAGKI